MVRKAFELTDQRGFQTEQEREEHRRSRADPSEENAGVAHPDLREQPPPR